jgi:hypothetical protein
MDVHCHVAQRFYHLPPKFVIVEEFQSVSAVADQFDLTGIKADL